MASNNQNIPSGLIDKNTPIGVVDKNTPIGFSGDEPQSDISAADDEEHTDDTASGTDDAGA
jgi:hypothetical protein